MLKRHIRYSLEAESYKLSEKKIGQKIITPNEAHYKDDFSAISIKRNKYGTIRIKRPDSNAFSVTFTSKARGAVVVDIKAFSPVKAMMDVEIHWMQSSIKLWQEGP